MTLRAGRGHKGDWWKVYAMESDNPEPVHLAVTSGLPAAIPGTFVGTFSGYLSDWVATMFTLRTAAQLGGVAVEVHSDGSYTFFAAIPTS